MGNKLEQVRRDLEEKDALKIRMRVIFDRAFQFREKIWGTNFQSERDEERFWEDVDKHPVRFRARFADMTNVFSKPWAERIFQEQEAQKSRERLTADKLEEMGLSDEAIEKLATVNEEPEKL